MASAEQRRKPRRRPATSAWRFVSAAGIALLGFAIGLVAGSVLEGPRLLIEWARGPSQGVDLALADPAPVETGRLLTELHEPDRKQPAPQPVAPLAPRETKPERAPRSPRPEAPAAAAAAPDAESAVPPAVPSKPAAAPRGSPAVAPRGTPVVQVASTRDPAEARRISARLRSGGFDVYSVAVSPNGTTTHRVRVRTKPGETPAQLADRLKAQGFETWITSD
jgi:cell division septation protein DedD